MAERLWSCPFQQIPLGIRKFEDGWLNGVTEEMNRPFPVGLLVARNFSLDLALPLVYSLQQTFLESLKSPMGPVWDQPPRLHPERSLKMAKCKSVGGTKKTCHS